MFLFRMAQNIARISLHGPKTSLLPFSPSTKLWPLLRPRRCYWRRLSSANRVSILHPQRQEARRRCARPQNAEFLPYSRSAGTVPSPRELWPTGLRIHRGECQEMGARTNDGQSCSTTAIWQRAGQYTSGGRQGRRKGGDGAQWLCSSCGSRSIRRVWWTRQVDITADTARAIGFASNKSWAAKESYGYQSRTTKPHRLERHGFRRGRRNERERTRDRQHLHRAGNRGSERSGPATPWLSWAAIWTRFGNPY